MIKLICDCCGKEKPVKKYILPQPKREVFKVTGGRNNKQVMAFFGQMIVEPQEVELCDDCALEMFYKMHWKE